MASKSLGTLTLDLIAKIGAFTGPLDKASRESQKRMAEISKSAKSAGTALGVGIGAGASIAAAALTAMVARQLDVIGDQADMAVRLRTTTESLGTLTRAAELSGIGLEQLESAGQKLDVALGKAAQGSKVQAEAFDRLGLSYEAVSAMPLDERISTINEALAKNIPITERAAVAATLFGAKNAAAIQMLDPDTLAEASRQVEVFGIKLSAVDSAKVEMAGDALSNFSLLADGVGKQLTVELAPILSAIGDQFLESAEKAGGLGTVVPDAVRKAVSAIAFLIDAGDGVKRVFSIVADSVIGTITTASGYASSAVAGLIEQLDRIPGIDLSDSARAARDFSNEQLAIAREAAASIQEELDRPLAGEAFKQFYDQAQKAGEAAAKAAVASRDAASAGQETAGEYASKLKAQEAAAKAAQQAAEKLQDTFESTEQGLSRQIALFGKTGEAAQLAYEIQSGKLVGINAEQQKRLEGLASELDLLAKQKEAADNYKSLVSDLRTEEEKRTQQLRDQMAIIDAMSDIQPAERKDMAARVATGLFEESPAPKFSGVDAGPLGELSKLDDAEKELQKWYDNQLEMLTAFRKERSDLNDEWDRREVELKQQHEDSLAAIERSRWQVGLDGMDSFLTQIQSLRDSDSKKGKQAAKAAAIVQATINAYTAATGAYASASAIPVVGWVLGPVAAAAALAAGLANVSAIQGMAHDGIDAVPETGTWLLQKGERVTTAETSAKLDRTLSSIQAGNGSAPQSVRDVNITFNQPNVQDSRDVRNANASTARQVARAIRNAQRYT